MILVLALLACTGAADDSADKVDNTCAFGPSAHIDSPAEGDVFAVGESVTLGVTASSGTTATEYLQIVWGVQGLSGEASGFEDTVGIGATVTWVPSLTGEWRVVVQVDDECSSDPAYDTPPAQTSVNVSVE